jgi:hypothetical protein
LLISRTSEGSSPSPLTHPEDAELDLLRLVRQIIALPTEQFLPLLHDMFRKEYEANKHKAPRVLPRVIEGHAGHVAPENGQAAG